MKQNYNSLRILFLLLIAGTNSKGQLNGVYTINSASPTAATNFSTFADCASALNTAGVSGAVTVNVIGNLTYTEQVLFNQAPGISPTQSVLINGNGRTLVASGTNTAPWTMGLNGADYMSVNNLTVIGTGTYALPCHLYNHANQNTFTACVFSVSAIGINPVRIPFSISGSATDGWNTGNAGNNNTMNTCTMTGGYLGSTVTGDNINLTSTANKFIDCSIIDFSYTGVSLTSAPGVLVKGCTIERPNLASTIAFYGIELSGNNAGATIDGNRFRKPAGALPTGSVGATCISLNGQQGAGPGTEINIRNNIGYDLRTNSYIYGVYCVGAQYARIYHNTFLFDDGVSTSTTMCQGIYINNAANTVSKNNVVVISRGGSGQKLGLSYVGIGNGTSISNGNCVYIAPGTANAFFGYHSTFGNQANYSAWQIATSMDAVGSNIDPQFVNPLGGNLMPTAAGINNIGLPLGVQTDILNALRSLSTPDPGAYEFSLTCGPANAPTLSIAGATAACGTGTVLATISGAHLYNWSNNSTSPAVTLTAGNYTASGTNTLTGCTATISWVVQTLALPNVSLAVNPATVCAGNQIFLSASGASTYTWAYGTNTVSGASFSVIPTGPTTYSGTGTNSLGCAKTETISIQFKPCTGIDQELFANGRITIFPNPANGDLTIQSGELDLNELFITDNLGRIVFKASTAGKTCRIDLENFMAGIYFVHCGKEVRKVLVLKEGSD